LSSNLVNIGQRIARWQARQPRKEARLMTKPLAAVIASLVLLLLFMFLIPDSLTAPFLLL
jgi:hypothetical protein